MIRGIATSEKLAKAMTECGCPEGMVKAARAGEYDNFRSKVAKPRQKLIEDLLSVGKAALINRVRAGEFDATAAEAKAWIVNEGMHQLIAREGRCSSIIRMKR